MRRRCCPLAHVLFFLALGRSSNGARRDADAKSRRAGLTVSQPLTVTSILYPPRKTFFGPCVQDPSRISELEISATNEISYESVFEIVKNPEGQVCTGIGVSFDRRNGGGIRWSWIPSVASELAVEYNTLSHRLAACKIQGSRPNIKKPFLTTYRNSTTRTPTRKLIVPELFFLSRYRTL